MEDQQGSDDGSPSPENAWESLSQDRKDFVWNVHKEADSLIHSRMQTFVTFETALIAALFTTVILPDGTTVGWIFRTIIVATGLLTSIVFIWLNERIIRGVIRLKKTYLLLDGIYAAFYGRGKPRYVLPRGLPAIFIILWCMLAYATLLPLPDTGLFQDR